MVYSFIDSIDLNSFPMSSVFW